MTDDSLKTSVVPSHFFTPDSSPLLVTTAGFSQSPQRVDDWRRSGSVHRGFSLPLLPSHSFPMLQHGLICRLHSCWGGTCSSVGPSWATVPLGSSCSGMDLFMGCSPFGGVLALVCGSSTAHSPLSGSASTTWSTSYSSDLGVPLAVSHSFCSLLLSQSDIFCPFLNMFSQRHHKLPWLAQLWCMMHPLLIQLEPSVFSTGQPWTSLLATPAAPSATQTLPPTPSTPLHKYLELLFTNIVLLCAVWIIS